MVSPLILISGCGSSPPAPEGRTRLAQGKRRSSAALGWLATGFVRSEGVRANVGNRPHRAIPPYRPHPFGAHRDFRPKPEITSRA